MLTKTLMVTIFILLSWNAFQASKSNAALRSEINQLSLSNEKIKEELTIIHSELEVQLSTVTKHSKLSLNNQKALKERLEKNTNKNKLANEHAKTLKSIKTTFKKLNNEVLKGSALNKENKKNILEVKKVVYKVSDQIKRHSKDSVSDHKHNASIPITQGKNSKKPLKRKTIAKKTTTKKDLNPFYKIAITLQKTKELHNRKETQKALEQLQTLKAEVWKSRKIDNSPTALVMSILSSIDITKNKWSNKETGYKLNKVEEKINELFSKLGVKQ